MKNENTYSSSYRPMVMKAPVAPYQQGQTKKIPTQQMTKQQMKDNQTHIQTNHRKLVGNNNYNLVDAVVAQNEVEDETNPENRIVEYTDPRVSSFAKPVFSPKEAPPTTAPVGSKIVVTHVDNERMAGNAFPAVFSDDPFFQQPQTNLIVNPVPAYLTIDSRDRDRSLWPNTNQYRIPLVAPDNDLAIMSPNVRYKNIYSISLLSCVVPNDGGVMFEPYLLLQIDEIDRVYDSANPASARAFTKLYFKEVCVGSKFFRLDKGVGDPLTKIYWPAPRASLESVTLSFRHPDGTLFDFGPDNALPGPVDPLLQTTITLEIRTFVVDTGKAIGHRNV